MGENGTTEEVTTVITPKTIASPQAAAVSIAVVGCGRLAETGYLPAIVDLDEVRLAALIDPDQVRRQTLAARASRDHGVVPTYPDLAAAIEVSTKPGRLGPRINGVILASPADTHAADAKLAAAAGMAVLVEKPPAADLTGAQAIAALTPQPWVAFNRRFDPRAGAVRGTVAGHTGPIEINAAIHYRRASWRSYEVTDDALDDLGPHLIDWVRWIGGREVDSVMTGRLTHDRVKLDLTLAGDGGKATIRAAANRTHKERMRVRDRDRRTLGELRGGGPVAGVSGRFRRGSHPLVESLRAQTKAFAAAIRDRAQSDPLGTAADGVAVMAVIAAARRSHDAGSAVALSDLDATTATP